MVTLPASLLAAIVAEPDDDLPRLLAADWFEERGESERAEFIRVQIRFALMVECGYTDLRANDGCRFGGSVNGCRRCLLIRRGRELFKSAGPGQCEWFGPVHNVTICGSEIAPHITWFRRGFIESITCTWQDWLTHNEAILAACPLRSVNLTSSPRYIQAGHVDGKDVWRVDDLAWLPMNTYPNHASYWPDIEFKVPHSIAEFATDYPAFRQPMRFAAV